MPPRLSDVTADLRDKFLLGDSVRFLSCSAFEHTTTPAAARAFDEKYPHGLSTPHLRKALDDGSLATRAQRHTPAPLAPISRASSAPIGYEYQGVKSGRFVHATIATDPLRTVDRALAPPRSCRHDRDEDAPPA
jgi:hypothetical protein